MDFDDDNSQPTMYDDVYSYYDSDYVVTPAMKVLLVTAQVTATLSLLSSMAIVVETRSDRRNRVDTPVSRVLFWMHLFHLPLDFFTMLGNLLVPEEVPMAWGARGNQATCTLSGAARMFGGVSSLIWDFFLSIIYLLMVRYAVPDSRLKPYEKYCHIVVWSIVLPLTILPIFFDAYNYDVGGCWVTPIPLVCNDGDIPCARGKHYTYFLSTVIALTFLQLAASVYSMVAIYLQIRRLEDRNSRYAGRSWRSINSAGGNSHDAGTARERSMQVAIQGLLYVSTALITLLPTTIQAIVEEIVPLKDIWWYVTNVAISLHGTLYWAFFLRNRKDMSTAYGRFMRGVFSGVANAGVQLLDFCRCRKTCPSSAESKSPPEPSNA